MLFAANLSIDVRRGIVDGVGCCCFVDEESKRVESQELLHSFYCFGHGASSSHYEKLSITIFADVEGEEDGRFVFLSLFRAIASVLFGGWLKSRNTVIGS